MLRVGLVSQYSVSARLIFSSPPPTTAFVVVAGVTTPLTNLAARIYGRTNAKSGNAPCYAASGGRPGVRQTSRNRHCRPEPEVKSRSYFAGCCCSVWLRQSRGLSHTLGFLSPSPPTRLAPGRFEGVQAVPTHAVVRSVPHRGLVNCSITSRSRNPLFSQNIFRFAPFSPTRLLLGQGDD